MSILNALSVFAGGAAQGYRAREETNRQIAEIKRKALLEEREQQIREAAQRTQEGLAKQQILESQTNIKSKEDELKRKSTPVSGDLGLNNLRGRLGIEHLDYGHLTDMQTLLSAMLREQGNMSELDFRVKHPYELGGNKKPYLLPEEQALLDLAEKKRQGLLSRIDPMQYAAEPEKYAPLLSDINRQVELDLPIRLRRLLQANRDSADADANRKPKEHPSPRGR